MLTVQRRSGAKRHHSVLYSQTAFTAYGELRLINIALLLHKCNIQHRHTPHHGGRNRDDGDGSSGGGVCWIKYCVCGETEQAIWDLFSFFILYMDKPGLSNRFSIIGLPLIYATFFLRKCIWNGIMCKTVNSYVIVWTDFSAPHINGLFIFLNELFKSNQIIVSDRGLQKLHKAHSDH